MTAQPLLNRPLQIPGPQDPDRASQHPAQFAEQALPAFSRIVPVVVPDEPHRPPEAQQRPGIFQTRRQRPAHIVQHFHGKQAIQPDLTIPQSVKHGCHRGQQQGAQRHRHCQEPDLRPHVDGPEGDFFVRRLPLSPQAEPQRQTQHARPQQGGLGQPELPALLEAPVRPVHPAGLDAPAGVVILDRRLPDGDIDLDAADVVSRREIVVTGDEPVRIPVIDAVAVDVQLFTVFPDGDFAVLKDQQKVVALRQR